MSILQLLYLLIPIDIDELTENTSLTNFNDINLMHSHYLYNGKISWLHFARH